MARKKPKSVLDYNYKVDTDLGLNWRIALFLDWAAQEMPGRAIPYQQIAKVVLVKSRAPSADSAEVKQVKSALTRARKILLSQYKRGLVPIDGMGVRATIDNEDLFENQVERDARRAAQAAEALDRSTSAVTASEIRNPEMKKRFNKLSKISKQLMSPDMFDHLRLPAPKKDK